MLDLNTEKYLDPKYLHSVVQSLRKEGKTLVTLNGSFDLLHSGHLKMLDEASKQGDVLLVALNSDASIKKYKSPLRPIITLKHRLEMMAALSCVSYVTYFEESNPVTFLSVVKPDVHVNGSEYGNNCIEAQVVKENGGRLHIVSLIEGLSTSNIIATIQQVCV